MDKIIEQAIELKKKNVDKLLLAIQQIQQQIEDNFTKTKTLQAKLQLQPKPTDVVFNFFQHRAAVSAMLSLEEKAAQDLESSLKNLKSELSAALIEKEKFVKYLERRKKARALILDRREQKQADELATQAFIRRPPVL